MADERPSDSVGRQNQRGLFPRTTGTIDDRIGRSRTGDPLALAELCEIYRTPILTFVRRWWWWDPVEAEDLAQKFIEVRLLRKNLFGRFARRRETKFRSFLIHCLSRFLIDEKRKIRIWVELPEEIPDRDGLNPLDHALAWEVHGQVMAELARVYGRSTELVERFQRLQAYVLDRGEAYTALAAELGLKEPALRKWVHDMRDRHHEGFRERVRQMLQRESRAAGVESASAGRILEEMRYLMGLLAYPNVRKP